MRFVVSSAALYSHLQTVSRVINSKNTLPILDCFLLEVDNNKLTITGADSETRLVTTLEINDVEGSGRIAISHRTLLDPLKELPDQPLTFQINDDNLETFIHYHNGKFSFVGQKADEYPQPKPLGSESQTVTVEPQILLTGINRTIFATADDELRPVMNGIFFDIATDSLTMVASDGHKLVRLKNTSVQSPQNASFILPKKPANLLKSILGKETETVEIQFDQNNAYITLGNYILTCRFIEGRYPNYAAVIPTNNTNKVVLERVALLNALKRVAVFSNMGSSLVKIQLEADVVKVFTQDLDFSTAAEESLPCQYIGSPMNIGFKSSFLIDVLNNIASENISIELSDPSRAGLIFPVENEENEDILMLLMPMMLND